MTRVPLALILLLCCIQVGYTQRSSSGGSSSRGSGGGWSSGSSSSSRGGSSWGSGGSRGSGSVGGGGWNIGGSSSSNTGSKSSLGTNTNKGNIGGGGWNLGGGSSSGSQGSSGSNPGTSGGWNIGSSGSKSSSGGIFGGGRGSSAIGGGLGGLLGAKHGSGSSGNNFNKKKGGKFKTLKRAAVIGAVAYGGYKLGKLTSRFSKFGHSHNPGYGFDDWNRWRSNDGFLCRNDMDCTWIDPSLKCDDYEFDFSPSNLWFGGDVASIRGQCECRNSFSWNDKSLHCIQRSSFFSSGARREASVIFLIASSVMFLAIT